MKKTVIFFLLLAAHTTLYAQQIKNLQTRFTGSNIEVSYTLTTNRPVDIDLQYSTDNGQTYQTCRTISGDWQSQTSGNKHITWECAEDGVFSAGVTFKIGVKEMDVARTNTERIRPEMDVRQPEREKGQTEIEMIFVKGGIFTMGCEDDDCNLNEKPAHSVSVNDFYIGKYEVTQTQWIEIMYNNPSIFKGDDLPVENVSWENVQEFIRKLNVKTGKKYRLPTEAEWEFAAKGGLQGNGYKYSGSNIIEAVAWYNGNAQGTTQPIGNKQPNELGIHDMSGNVWEWCQDWYGRYDKTNQANPKGPSSGSERVFRGGGLYVNEKYCRTTIRNSGSPQQKNRNLGFRLVLPI